MAPESNELEYVCFFSLYKLLTFVFREDVRPSPTKRFKKPTPGSLEFESQPAVVITYVTGCLLQVANHIFEAQNTVTNRSGASSALDRERFFSAANCWFIYLC
jgi:hypothetical protein